MNIGLKHPVCAPYSVGEGNTPTYANGWVMGAGVKITPGTEKNDSSFYADDTLYMSDNSVKGGTISEEISHMLAEKYAQLLGHKYTAATESEPESVEIGDDEAIEVGHGYVVTQKYKDDNGKAVTKYVVVWYYRVKFSEPNDGEATTRGESIEYTSVSLEGKWSKACNGKYGKKYYFDDEDKAIAFLDKLAGIAAATTTS